VKITQGTFSFLPPLRDQEIEAQVWYAIDHGWSVSLEHTDDAHPRSSYWEMWGPPLFDLEDPDLFMRELAACRQACPDRYVKVNAYDRSVGRQSLRLSFIVHRPAEETGFRLERQETADRRIRYALRPSGRA